MVATGDYLVVSALLFTIGATGVFFRRSLISIFLCIELMLNGVNLTFVAFARETGNLEGQAIALLVIAVAAAEAAIGLALLIAFHRKRGTINVDDATLMRH